MTTKATTIGILIPEFPSQTHIFFWREIQALRELGVAVHILSTKRPDLSKNQHEFASQVRNTFYLVPFPFLACLFFCIAHLRWFIACAVYALKLKESPLKEKLKVLAFIPAVANLLMEVKAKDIQHVHAHSCASSAHIVAMAHMFRALPYSISVHGNLSEYGYDHLAKMKRAKFVATVTRPLKDEVLAACPGYSESRVPVIAMGVDLSKFLFQETKTPEARFRLTSVSRLAYVKGHTYALQALAHLPDDLDYEYLIAGDGEMRSQLEAEVSQLGLSKKVRFLGFQSEGEVLELLQTTDIFLLTSFGKGEAAPVAIMEAMACGKAVICSIIGGTADMIDDGVDGLLVPQQDPIAIGKSIFALLSNPVQMKNLGQAARQTAEQKFCHRAQAKRLLEQILD